MSGMNEKLNRWLILLTVLFGLTALGAAGVQHHFGGSGKSSVAGGEYLYDTVSYIEINALTIDVHVKTYDGDKIKLVYANDTALSVNEGDNKITITQNNDFVISFFAFRQFSYEMTLYLPDEIYRDIFISTTTGNISADNLNCNSLELATKSGEITADSVKSAFKASSVSGGISCSYYALIQDCDIASKTGSVTVELPEKTRFMLYFTTKSGSISSSVFLNGEPVRESFRYARGGDGKRIVIATDGDAYITENIVVKTE